MVNVAPFVAVAAAAALLLVAAASIAIRRWAAWVRGGRGLAGQLRAMGRRQRWTEIVALAGGAAVVVGIVDAFVEPYRPIVERVVVEDLRIAPGPPIRIVQLSDLHSGSRVRLEDTLPARVAELAPDFIVFTGDAVNESAGVEHFRRTMTALAKIAPTFAVRGNWDVWWFPHARLFDDTGVRELKGEAVPITVRGQEIWIVGIPVDSEGIATRVFSRVPPGRPIVFLHHYPWAAKIAAARGAMLHLAGDTHGGQARLPWYGDLVRIARHGVWRPLGLQRAINTWVYVNRGIGMEGGLPPVRFRCRPEITLIELGGR